MFNTVITDIYSGKTATKDLFNYYSDNLKKGVSGVLNSDKYGDKYYELQAKLQANVSRFSAYKAYKAGKELEALRTNDNGTIRSKKDYEKIAKATLNMYNRWQVAEYNATVSRSRTAEQWQRFNENSIENELYPNIEWLPSMSAEQREEHKKFYNQVWTKNDPFWDTNQPGNLWGCKCDWRTTDKPPTNPNVATRTAAAGLDGNPGKTGQIFSEDASYIKNNLDKESEIYSILRKENLEAAFKKLKDVTVEKQTKTEKINVSFTKKGLEHLQHDFFPNKWLKNIILQNIDKVLEKAEFVDEAKDAKNNIMIEKYYYYKITLFDKDYLLNIRKLKTGEAYLYSLTNRKA